MHYLLPTPPLEVGAVYTISAPRLDALLLGLLVDFDDVNATLFPVSAEVRWAADWDLLLDPEALGYAAIAESWNVVEVLTTQLCERLAMTPDGHVAADVYDRMFAGAELPEELPQAPQIVSGRDPRHAFRERERERVVPYTEPAAELILGPCYAGDHDN